MQNLLGFLKRFGGAEKLLSLFFFCLLINHCVALEGEEKKSKQAVPFVEPTNLQFDVENWKRINRRSAKAETKKATVETVGIEMDGTVVTFEEIRKLKQEQKERELRAFEVKDQRINDVKKIITENQEEIGFVEDVEYIGYNYDESGMEFSPTFVSSFEELNKYYSYNYHIQNTYQDIDYFFVVALVLIVIYTIVDYFYSVTKWIFKRIFVRFMKVKTSGHSVIVSLRWRYIYIYWSFLVGILLLEFVIILYFVIYLHIYFSAIFVLLYVVIVYFNIDYFKYYYLFKREVCEIYWNKYKSRINKQRTLVGMFMEFKQVRKITMDESKFFLRNLMNNVASKEFCTYIKRIVLPHIVEFSEYVNDQNVGYVALNGNESFANGNIHQDHQTIGNQWNNINNNFQLETVTEDILKSNLENDAQRQTFVFNVAKLVLYCKYSFLNNLNNQNNNNNQNVVNDVIPARKFVEGKQVIETTIVYNFIDNLFYKVYIYQHGDVIYRMSFITEDVGQICCSHKERKSKDCKCKQIHGTVYVHNELDDKMVTKLYAINGDLEYNKTAEAKPHSQSHYIAKAKMNKILNEAIREGNENKRVLDGATSMSAAQLGNGVVYNFCEIESNDSGRLVKILTRMDKYCLKEREVCLNLYYGDLTKMNMALCNIKSVVLHNCIYNIDMCNLLYAFTVSKIDRIHVNTQIPVSVLRGYGTYDPINQMSWKFVKGKNESTLSKSNSKIIAVIGNDRFEHSCAVLFDWFRISQIKINYADERTAKWNATVQSTLDNYYYLMFVVSEAEGGVSEVLSAKEQTCKQCFAIAKSRKGVSVTTFEREAEVCQSNARINKFYSMSNRQTIQVMNNYESELGGLYSNNSIKLFAQDVLSFSEMFYIQKQEQQKLIDKEKQNVYTFVTMFYITKEEDIDRQRSKVELDIELNAEGYDIDDIVEFNVDAEIVQLEEEYESIVQLKEQVVALQYQNFIGYLETLRKLYSFIVFKFDGICFGKIKGQALAPRSLLIEFTLKEIKYYKIEKIIEEVMYTDTIDNECLYNILLMNMKHFILVKDLAYDALNEIKNLYTIDAMIKNRMLCKEKIQLPEVEEETNSNVEDQNIDVPQYNYVQLVRDNNHANPNIPINNGAGLYNARLNVRNMPIRKEHVHNKSVKRRYIVPEGYEKLVTKREYDQAVQTGVVKMGIVEALIVFDSKRKKIYSSVQQLIGQNGAIAINHAVPMNYERYELAAVHNNNVQLPIVDINDQQMVVVPCQKTYENVLVVDVTNTERKYYYSTHALDNLQCATWSIDPSLLSCAM